jgi:hypothetical protein
MHAFRVGRAYQIEGAYESRFNTRSIVDADGWSGVGIKSAEDADTPMRCENALHVHSDY